MKLEVSKSIEIEASLGEVRALVEDFNQWSSWSPWIVIEPSCPVSVSGSPKAIGHAMSWDGKVIGAGKNTLCAYDDNQLDFDLSFLKPWKSKAKVSFIFEEQANITKLTWSMKSSMPFFVFFMLKTMKNWIGMDYQRGLRMLKELAEKGSLDCETKNTGLVHHSGFSYVGLERTVAFNQLAENLSKDFERLVSDLVEKGNRKAEHWVCLYPKFNMKTMVVTYIAAVSDEDVSDLELSSNYVRGQIDSCSALEIKHKGSYEFLGNAWAMGMMNMRAQKLKARGAPFEQYWNNPLELAPSELLSSVYFPTVK